MPNYQCISNEISLRWRKFKQNTLHTTAQWSPHWCKLFHHNQFVITGRRSFWWSTQAGDRAIWLQFSKSL